MPVYSKQVAENVAGYFAICNKKDFPGEYALFSFYAKKTGGPILDLTCGAGRIMIDLAQQGFEVYGVEASPHMIEIGKRRVVELDPPVRSRIHFFEGDMSDFRLPQRFPLVMISYNSFWFNSGSMKNGVAGCLERILEHLLPRGIFLVDEPGNREWWENKSFRHKFVFRIMNYNSKDADFLSMRKSGYGRKVLVGIKRGV